MKNLLSIDFSDQEMSALNAYAKTMGVSVGELVESSARRHLDTVTGRKPKSAEIILFRVSKDIEQGS
tara:strand:- start:821 stop:1021 length:201 start_codon:yes stop_codon:yes gene_type:complete